MNSQIDNRRPLLEGLSLTPEERLLLACARVQLDQRQREELETLVRGPVNWDQMLYKARWHNITPLVFHHLNDLEDRSYVPSGVMAQLKSAYSSNVVLNLHFQAQMRRVQEVLEDHEVPVTWLKGAALAGTVYKDIGLRSMGDLDLLVPEDQVYVAQEAVRSLGYNPVSSTEWNHRHLPRLLREGTAAQVEVHRHIVNRDTTFYFDIADFWSRVQEVSLARRRVRVLAPEDLLIHLTVNFFQDRRFKSASALRQLCDVAESLRFYGNSISWQLLLDNVRKYRVAGPVGCVIYLAQGLLNTPVPEEAAQRLWASGFHKCEMERFARRRVLDTRDWVAHALVQPETDYKPSGVAMAVLRRLFPSRRILARRYQRPASGVQGFLMYLSLMRDGIRILSRSLMRPARLREDIAIDRWHHSMYTHHNGTGNGRR